MTTATATISAGTLVRDTADGQIGTVHAVVDGGYAVVWTGDIRPIFAEADEVEPAELTEADLTYTRT